MRRIPSRVACISSQAPNLIESGFRVPKEPATWTDCDLSVRKGARRDLGAIVRLHKIRTFRLQSHVLSAAIILLTGGNALADEAYGMTPVPPGSHTQIYQVDMPPTREQPSAGICFAEVASLLVDRQTCVERKIAECGDLRPELSVSALDMSRFAGQPVRGDKYNREEYVGLQEGGSLSTTLDNSLQGAIFATEACAPTAQLLPREASQKQREKEKDQLRASLMSIYDRHRKSLGGKTSDVVAEFSQLRKKFDFKATDEQVIRAFAQKSFSAMLDTLLIGDRCRWDEAFDFKGHYEVKTFPHTQMPAGRDSYVTAMDVIKELLQDGTPIGVTFCGRPGKAKYASLEQCKNGGRSGETWGHAVVIKGYGQVCKQDGSDCDDAVQIQNSWGDTWQNQNNDGWIDAREFLDRTFYAPAALVWLEKQGRN